MATRYTQNHAKSRPDFFLQPSPYASSESHPVISTGASRWTFFAFTSCERVGSRSGEISLRSKRRGAVLSHDRPFLPHSLSAGCPTLVLRGWGFRFHTTHPFPSATAVLPQHRCAPGPQDFNKLRIPPHSPASNPTTQVTMPKLKTSAR